MVANTNLVVADLDFSNIKTNLKNYLRNQSVFNDYDFDSSAMSILLDVLAYNTYYNNYYLNMAANEAFLDTAQLRENVVSRAKELNYIPRSSKSSHAQLSLTIVTDDSPNEIVIPAYTQFTSVLDNITYTFSTQQDYTLLNDGHNTFSATIDIYEGNVLTYSFNVTDTSPKLDIPNQSLDTDSVVVKVFPNINSTTFDEYTLYDNLTNITNTSKIYFLEENKDGNYTIYFGDNILGVRPSIGNVVKITTRFCHGTTTNSIQSFSPTGYVAYNKITPTKQYSASSINTLTASEDGQDREEIETIRLNAPKFYAMQNRLVTVDDYKSFVLSKFTDINAIAVWGGEDNDPPYYGKVFLSLKPTNGFTTSLLRKKEIISELDKYNVLSIDPIIADPIFTFINLSFKVVYDSKSTTLTQSQLYSKFSTAITNYETNNLGLFNKSFGLSDMISKLMVVDPSILNIQPTLLMEQRILPVLNSNVTYDIKFNEAIRHPYDGYLGAISSSGFMISGSPNVYYIDDDGLGSLRMYTISSERKVYLDSNVGTVNYSTGELIFTRIITSVFGDIDEIRIFMQPDDTIYTPIRNEILLLSYPTITMYDNSVNKVVLIQTVNTLGTSGTPIKSNKIFLPAPNINV